MGVFGQNSNRARRRGEISALDEFSYHVPEHCDVRTTRLEIDCFKKKREFVPRKNTQMISKHDNSLESLRSECDSDIDQISQEIDICLSANEYDLSPIFPISEENEYPPQNGLDCQFANIYDAPIPEKCQKMLSHPKCTSTKVLLYPEEEWAKNARTVQWTIKINKWWKRYCTVIECGIGGLPNHSAAGKICQNRDGTLTITGRFKRPENPDFKLHLTAQVSKNDSQKGYVMTGALQLGDTKKNGSMEITHFAAIPKHQQ